MDGAVSSEEVQLIGAPIGSGIAVGRPFWIDASGWQIDDKAIPETQLDAEVERYREALSHCEVDLTALRNELKTEGAAEGAAILDAQIQLLSDPLLTVQVEEQIYATRREASTAFIKLIQQYETRFSEIPDPFFRERFRDIEDLAHRIVAQLNHSQRQSLADVPENSVILAENVAPSDAAEVHAGQSHGFVTSSIGVASHMAIVAKAKGIPYVGGVDLSSIPRDGIRDIVVDGQAGKVILNPGPETLEHYRQLQQELASHQTALHLASRLPAETLDGTTIQLAGNVESPDELELLRDFNASGIGLYRSEYLLLSKKRMPSEEEQYSTYRQLVEGMAGQPVVIRTFDVGADKQVETKNDPVKGNALGCRAIRLFLREPEVFKTQLRAILRAARHGQAKVLFPMISGLSELRACKALLAEAADELRAKGIEVPEVPVGCMIEVPAAAIICDLIAKECDFLSIGTNDLVQYILAVDRETAASDFLYRPTAPGIIRTIKMVVKEANRQRTPVTVCGEVAADPQFTPLLIGLGVREFSIAPRHLPVVKHVVRQLSIEASEKLAAEVLALSTAQEIHQTLIEAHAKLG